MALFTKETGKAFSAIGAARRWEIHRQAIAAGLPAAEVKKQKPEPEPPIIPPLPEVADKFPSALLQRVRRHLNRVNNLLDHETSPNEICKLAVALDKLAEVERVLDGRPTPGQHRPKSTGTSKRAQVAEPVGE
jgi:hypothetical protein